MDNKKEKINKIISLKKDVDELEDDSKTIGSIQKCFDGEVKKFYFYSNELSSLDNKMLYEILSKYKLMQDFRDFFIKINQQLQEKKLKKEFDLEELIP